MKKSERHIDPRTVYVKTKYRDIGKIIAFSSGKGGVGKSTLSAFSAMYLANEGFKVGLLDLDLYGPSCHLILGADIGKYPEEKNGVVPPKVSGVYFMSSVFYSENKPLVVRGKGLNDAALEIMTITNWPNLDYLIIDMPPGLGDILLDVSELLTPKFVVVTNESRISMESVKKLLFYIKEQGLPLLGLVENMKMSEGDFIERECKNLNVPYIGKVGFYPDIEENYGEKDGFLKKDVFKDIAGIWRRIHESS